MIGTAGMLGRTQGTPCATHFVDSCLWCRPNAITTHGDGNRA